MALNIAKELHVMERMTVDELRRKYADVFNESTNGRHKQWLIRRIAWRMQANAEGGLSERAQRRAAELADDADLRVTPPREFGKIPQNRVTGSVTQPLDKRLPAAGSAITRVYKGRTVVVKVLEHGFEFEGERFKSLSAVAKAATGKHWNGFHFFGLSKSGGRK